MPNRCRSGNMLLGWKGVKYLHHLLKHYFLLHLYNFKKFSSKAGMSKECIYPNKKRKAVASAEAVKYLDYCLI